MKLLVLGGTLFLGRHIVAAALSAGHEITLFNRGRHHPDLFPQAEKLRGDRDGNLEALQGGRWDAVVDTCAYVPRIARAAAELLRDCCDRYTFISTISVYPDLAVPGIREETPVARLDDPAREDVNGETYGPLKALCEEAVEAVLPNRVLTVRPGLIVGPHDPTDRFTYWPHRLAQGGEVLAPGAPEREVQFIDVRDLAEWIVRMIESGHTGTFNATGPECPLTMLGLLEACRTVSNRDTKLTWVDETFLEQQAVAPYADLPLWLPGEHDTVDCRRARDAALTYRLLEETIQDTLEWDQARPKDAPRRAGLTPRREKELLGLWHAECLAQG